MSGTKLNAAKEAGKNVVNTLSNNDFVGVASFSSTARTLHSSKIERATFELK